jgi:hypothetical protein
MLVKKLFWVAVGAAGALQVDKWLSERRARFTPNAMTGALLDRVNRRLESKQGATPPAEPGL